MIYYIIDVIFLYSAVQVIFTAIEGLYLLLKGAQDGTDTKRTEDETGKGQAPKTSQ